MELSESHVLSHEAAKTIEENIMDFPSGLKKMLTSDFEPL